VDNSYLEEIYRWEVTCLDLKTGKELWKQVARKGSPKGRKHAASNYACETPVTDGKRVYAYFGMNGLFCYDLNGKLLWQKEIEAKETQKNWGTGSSPVIYNNILYVLNDNEEDSWIMALDAATGNEKWKVKRQEPTTYGTPVIWKNNARTELVTMGKTARSYDPATGNLLWELKIGGEQAIASPVYDKENIYLGNSGGREIITDLFCVKAGAAGDITPADSGLVSSGVKWTVRKANVNNPSPLLYDGLIYIVAGRGGDLSCFEAATGSLVYKTKVPKVGACWATPWIQNGKLYFFDEKGITQVVKTGKIFESIATNTLDDKFWASVAITDKAYIFKGVKKIWCVGGTE
jgi:outer membrane protein assembly factor BamB